MPFQLVVIAGPDKGRVFELVPGSDFSIGRGAQSDSHLVDVAVSRIHCVVRIEDQQAVVRDENSRSGTYVNGQQIAAKQELRPGNVVMVGGTQLRFEHDVAEEPTAAPVEAPPAKELVFANKSGGRVLPRALTDLHDLVGQALGNYQVLSVLGTGQVGVVFLARDAKDHKMVALKVLRPDLSKDKKTMQRFVRGMLTVRNLHHPNVIELYNAGVTGQHGWIAMEWVDGPSLAEVIQKMPAAPHRDWKPALRVAIQLSRALGYIHAQGLIHRSVMPQNVLVQKSDETAKLGDAMLAKALEGDDNQEVTASGELVGNFFYMAPERTARDAEVDGRADFYSLGVTLYFMLTGRMPFEGPSMLEVIAKVRQATPVSPSRYVPSLPAALEAVVLKLLAKTPEGRYATAAELLADLERVAEV